jgi:L-asparagine oxygenase
MNSTNCIIDITNDELEILTALVEKITANPTENPELFCKQSKECSENVPRRLKEKLQDFKINGNECGFLLFKNILIDETRLPNTPHSNNERIGENTILAKIQSLLLNVVGEMISYEAEGYGRLFQDVVPVKSMEKEQTSVGSNTELEIHTEQAFSKLRPDILSLSCLRGDEQAFTYVLPVQKILSNLTDGEKWNLYNPLWKIGVDLSFKLNNNDFIEGEIRGPIPILSGLHNDPMLIFDQDLMTGINEDATKIKDKIINIYYENRYHHNLKPGEIILIDNLRAVHGRSRFSPRYDGYDRFLVRCFAVFDLEKSEYARVNERNKRMVCAIYS